MTQSMQSAEKIHLDLGTLLAFDSRCQMDQSSGPQGKELWSLQTVKSYYYCPKP